MTEEQNHEDFVVASLLLFFLSIIFSEIIYLKILMPWTIREKCNRSKLAQVIERNQIHK